MISHTILYISLNIIFIFFVIHLYKNREHGFDFKISVMRKRDSSVKSNLSDLEIWIYWTYIQIQLTFHEKIEKK